MPTTISRGSNRHDWTKVPIEVTDTVNPTAGADVTLGFGVGSKWINTASDEEFTCVDATAGAAVWKSTTAQGTGGAIGDAYAISHEADATAHPASSIVNTPAGGVSATSVQAAINELDTEKAALVHGHAAAASPNPLTKLWNGTLAEYAMLASYDADTMYCVDVDVNVFDWIAQHNWITTLAFNNVAVTDIISVVGIMFTAHDITTTVAAREFSISGDDTADAAEFIACLTDATYGISNITASNAAGTVTLTATDVARIPLIVTAPGSVTVTRQQNALNDQLRLYTGSPPSTLAAAPTGTLLWFVDLAAQTPRMKASVAVASGTPGYYRKYRGADCFEQNTYAASLKGPATLVSGTQYAIRDFSY